MKIDPSKKYKTTNGLEAIIHSTNGPDRRHPIVASVLSGPDDAWDVEYWAESAFVEVREPREWKVRVALSGNPMHESGAIITEHLDDMIPHTEKSRWEIVRVREIIEP